MKNRITWTAPDSACSVNVKIVVDDGKSETSESKTLVVMNRENSDL